MPPSDYPAFAQLLVAAEIDSISLNSDSLLKAMAVIVIVETENAAGQPPQPAMTMAADGERDGACCACRWSGARTAAITRASSASPDSCRPAGFPAVWAAFVRFTEVAVRYGAVMLLVGLTGGVSGQPAMGPLRQMFLQRVDEYVALHRRLEATLPQAIVTVDPEAILAPRRALAAAIRTARADARQGDIFSPPLAAYFRTVLADALRAGGITDMLAIVEDENSVHRPAQVNGDYPAGRSIPLMPTCLLLALPPLPPELQYAFVGRDLILRDVHAGLIVDIVPRAIPKTMPD